jgi:hypothetical protein
MLLTKTLIFARALSRSVQSIVTLLRTWVTTSVAMTLRLSFAYDFEHALVCSECVVESNFVIIQSEIDAALIGFF